MQRKTPIKRKFTLKRSAPLTRQRKTKPPDPGLQLYYQSGIGASTWICENCHGHIAHNQTWQLYAAQCHILPKEDYPEVRAIPANRLHLCARCHNDYDSSWYKASRMPVFRLAIERLKTFYLNVEKTIPDVFILAMAS